MCGICGWVGEETVDAEILGRMTDAIAHRGPDHQGTYVRDNLGFGHTRLSILDLSELGNQPMHSDDGSVTVTYNGEFYDFERYRQELVAEGSVFRSHCDTEVIIHLYLRHGISFVEKLRGMFALAIWDNRSDELFLIRDRVGKKPLYYSVDGGRILFASEIKSLLCHPELSRTIDPGALDTYFRLGYVPKALSIFESVRKLEAGHFLRYKKGQVEIRRYWQIPAARESASPDWNSASEHLQQLLEESVSLRLVSDVPVGVLLSGGTDSSVIATLAAAKSKEKLKTFSIGFDDAKFNELPYARQIAEHIGSDHYEHIVTLDEIALLEELAPYFDEPFADPSLLPTYLVSRMAREHVKVAISGDGGDELFGGYNWYDWVMRHNKFMVVPKFARSAISQLASLGKKHYPGRHFLSTLNLDEFGSFLERTSAFFGSDIDHVLSRSVQNAAMIDYERHYRSSGQDCLERMTRTDFDYYLADDILTKVDRASMAVALEVRVPLLDHKICEFAFSLPGKYKNANGERKRLLRYCARRILPPTFDFDRKQGFVMPLRDWMARSLGGHLEELLACADFDQLLNRNGIRILLKEHREGFADHARKLWTVLMFCHWKLAVDKM